MNKTKQQSKAIKGKAIGDGGKAWKQFANKNKEKLFEKCGCPKGQSHNCGK